MFLWSIKLGHNLCHDSLTFFHSLGTRSVFHQADHLLHRVVELRKSKNDPYLNFILCKPNQIQPQPNLTSLILEHYPSFSKIKLLHTIKILYVWDISEDIPRLFVLFKTHSFTNFIFYLKQNLPYLQHSFRIGYSKSDFKGDSQERVFKLVRPYITWYKWTHALEIVECVCVSVVIYLYVY